jgi:hypothetical protein
VTFRLAREKRVIAVGYALFCESSLVRDTASDIAAHMPFARARLLQNAYTVVQAAASSQTRSKETLRDLACICCGQVQQLA